jgi:hypothetical protein
MWTAEKTLTTQEREAELVRASERYARGDITAEEFREIESRLQVKYRRAASAVGRARRLADRHSRSRD